MDAGLIAAESFRHHQATEARLFDRGDHRGRQAAPRVGFLRVFLEQRPEIGRATLQFSCISHRESPA
jgi:hypothetical protein